MTLRFQSNLFFMLILVLGSRNSAVGTATGYGLESRRLGVRVLVGLRFFCLHVAQTGSGAHPTSYPMDTEGPFPGVKRSKRKADHLSPTNDEVKNTWIYLSTSQYVFVV
jgi:hypothetical protein